MGCETVVAEGGSVVSGGQRQRLALARALAPEPRILVRDEATSDLDSATEVLVSEHLTAAGVTSLVIAHRLSAIQNARPHPRDLGPAGRRHLSTRVSPPRSPTRCPSARVTTPMFTCARVAGWSAHIPEQKREARLIRPTAKYVGEGPWEGSAV